MKNILNSRWYIMALTLSATFLVVGVCRLCLPVLFKEIADDLQLDLVGVGAVWGIDPLAGVFMSLPAGLIIDRFGVKKTMIAVCILSAVFGGLRGLSVNFATMAFTTFLFGVVGSTVATLGTKVTAVWFKDKYLQLTNALIFISLYMGQMAGSMFSATVFSPLLGGWRNVLFVYSVPVLITGILWFTVRNKLSNETIESNRTETVGMVQSLWHVMHIKIVWIMGLVLFALLGLIIAVNGYLPLYLRGIGWDAVGSDSALTLMLAGALVGTLPVMFSTSRLMAPRTMLVVSIIVMSLCIALIPFFTGQVVVVLVALAGFLRAIPSVLITVVVLQSKEVGTEYAGTAIGLMYTLGMLGAFIFPLGNGLATITPGLPFIFWAVICALSLTGFLFLRKGHAPA